MKRINVILFIFIFTQLLYMSLCFFTRRFYNAFRKTNERVKRFFNGELPLPTKDYFVYNTQDS